MSPEPLATYRLQLHAGFTLHDAAALADYLAALGVSHAYLSPCLEAAPGSTHGYDVVDPQRVRAALGGPAAWAALGRALAAQGLRRLLDIVPNHMAAVPENPWWWDVLAHGRASRWAGHFDVDWESPVPGLRGRILLPLLPAPLETLIGRGDVRVERSGDGLVLRVGDVTLPVAPGSVDPGGAAAVNDDPAALAAALARQHYELASWRDERRHLNYRRFFDIDRLVALRAEDERVFADTHATVLGWVAAGELDALRVDHPDGLADPEQYCRRLRAAAPDAWVVVEKILASGEDLPTSWPVDGTTGYEFLARVDGLFVDPAGEEPLTRCWADFTGASVDHAAEVRATKRALLQGGLASDVARIARLLTAVARAELCSEALAPAAGEAAVVALAASFDVYRTYVRPADGHLARADERRVAAALAAASAAGEADPRVLALLREVLLLRVTGADAAELATRFQQLTAAIMAKAVEDTVYYRFNRLLALNEVGGNLERFGTPPEEFHAACLATWQRAPHTLLATSTHDTKRSEDVRARLILLSEMPEAWDAAVRRWSALNARHRASERFDRNAEYHLYQTLVGAWPIGVERVTAYMEKAVREAKEHTSWTEPDADYEAAMRRFVEGALADARFVADLEGFVRPLVAAGRMNGLAQTLLKLTAPGVPDLYQGTELWEHSLVDPDNRRPVDFARRRRLLAELDELTPEEIVARSDEGLPKLWVIRQALALRRRAPALFGRAGAYRPLGARGSRAEHVVAFARGDGALTIVPRLVLRLRSGYGDAVLPLPGGLWRNVLTGETVAGGDVPVAALWKRFPVALLVRVA